MLRRYRRDGRGASAAEFALLLPILALPILNVIDLATYAYDRMELDNAAQVAAQAALAACSPNSLPATTNCPGLSGAETAAAKTTTLGSRAAIIATSENFYCLNSAGAALVTVGQFPTSKPADCAAEGHPGETPGDYVQVTASYSYSPIFAQASVASFLISPITRTAWMRLD